MVSKFKKILGSKMERMQSYRVVSVDALRGLNMIWIVCGSYIFIAFFDLSNNPLRESLALQFEHLMWNRYTFWDLIFLYFMYKKRIILKA